MVTQYYTASSLDGFIATPDNSLDWLLSQDIDPEGPMPYGEFITGVGAIAMGATTYEWLLAHGTDEGGPAWPYTVPSWVFTHRELPRIGDGIEFTQADVRDVHAEMVAAAGGRNVWLVGGGDLVGQFADHGLLDELWVQYAPVTLGAGAPLLPRRLDLVIDDVAQNRAFACVRYRVAR